MTDPRSRRGRPARVDAERGQRREVFERQVRGRVAELAAARVAMDDRARQVWRPTKHRGGGGHVSRRDAFARAARGYGPPRRRAAARDDEVESRRRWAWARIRSGVPARARPNALSGVMTSARSSSMGARVARNVSGARSRTRGVKSSGQRRRRPPPPAGGGDSRRTGARRGTRCAGWMTSSGGGSKRSATAIAPSNVGRATRGCDEGLVARWTPSKTPRHTAAGPVDATPPRRWPVSAVLIRPRRRCRGRPLCRGGGRGSVTFPMPSRAPASSRMTRRPVARVGGVERRAVAEPGRGLGGEREPRQRQQAGDREDDVGDAPRARQLLKLLRVARRPRRAGRQPRGGGARGGGRRNRARHRDHVRWSARRCPVRR